MIRPTGYDPAPMNRTVVFGLAFAIGASVVVIPFLFLSGTPALVLAITMSMVALLVVGGVLGRLSGRGVVFSALRQLACGVGAALVAGAVLEKPISQMFSYSYHVTGTWADPKVEKLGQTSAQPVSGAAEGGRK